MTAQLVPLPPAVDPDADAVLERMRDHIRRQLAAPLSASRRSRYESALLDLDELAAKAAA